MLFDYERIFCFLAFCLSITLTYIMALAVEGGTATFIFFIIELATYFWYSLSYIPDSYGAAWALISCHC
ncbi:MAG: hypothetical protein A2286_10370 [Gammaproteobacteria bacterium RIFOXYA12_FULL_61_12]|nr:MAG: hypothetical protein A2286_10370 [Gammaproteobacteria bacterium RIFOXYA12_FULL_61_12]